MSFLTVAPDMVTAAAGNLESVGSALNEAAAAAAPATVGLAAPAADRVSAVVAAMLGAYARDFQGISAQIAGFHNQFVGALRGGAAAYASAEAANVQQTVVNAVNAPAQALLGHPLIGPETVGSSAAAVSFGFGPLLLAGSDPLLAVPFSYPASLPTPFGPVTMTLNGSFDPLTQQVVFDSGSLTAPAPFVYGLGCGRSSSHHHDRAAKQRHSIFRRGAKREPARGRGRASASSRQRGDRLPVWPNSDIAVDTGAIESGLRVGGYQRSGRGALGSAAARDGHVDAHIWYADCHSIEWYAVWRPSSRPTQRFLTVCGQPPQTA